MEWNGAERSGVEWSGNSTPRASVVQRSFSPSFFLSFFLFFFPQRGKTQAGRQAGRVRLGQVKSAASHPTHTHTHPQRARRSLSAERELSALAASDEQSKPTNKKKIRSTSSHQSPPPFSRALLQIPPSTQLPTADRLSI